MNPSTGIQAGNALSRLGETIAQTGQDVGKIMETTVKAEEETQLMRMQQDWDAASQKQQQFQMDNPNDPLAWQDNMDKSMSAIEAKNGGYKFYTQAGKQASQMKFEQWRHNSKMSIGRASHTKVLNNRLEIAFVDMENQLEQKNFAAAHNTLEQSQQWMSPAVVEREKKKIEAAEYNDVLDYSKEAIGFDPVGSLPQIKGGEGHFAHVKKEDRGSLHKYTQGVIAEKAKTQADNLLALASSPEGLTPQSFDKLEADGQLDAISKGQRAKYRKGLLDSSPMTGEELSDFSTRISKLKDMQDSGVSQLEYMEAYNELEIDLASRLPAGSNGWLRQNLNSLNPNYKAKAADEYLKGNRKMAMSNMGATLSDMKTAGKFRDPNRTQADSYDPITNKYIPDPSEGQAMRKVEKKFSDWLMASDENVSLDDVNNKIDELVGAENARHVHKLDANKQVMRNGKVIKLKNNHRGTGRVSGATNTNGGTWKTVSTVPFVAGGPPANVRYNNPAAAFPRKQDEKYGVLGYGVLNDGEGNKIAHFPTPVHGAAANFDLFAKDYSNMSFKRAMTKWRGRESKVPQGYDPEGMITKDFLNNQEKAIDFFKKMAVHESPNFSMSDDEWKQAYNMWKAVQQSS